MNLTTVCMELDDQAVRMLDLMKQYIDLKMTLEDLVKTGSLHLAKSRYIMGNKSVSVMQLPTEDSELSAFVKVVEKDSDESLRLELSRMSLSSPDKEEPNVSQDSQEDGLKRRKGKGKGTEENSTNETKQTEEDQPEKTPKKKDVMQDPLKWFGVLVPQNMRLAQSSFNKAIEISVEVANVQLEMDNVKQKYLDLLEKKKELTSQSSETDEKS